MENVTINTKEEMDNLPNSSTTPCGCEEQVKKTLNEIFESGNVQGLPSAIVRVWNNFSDPECRYENFELILHYLLKILHEKRVVDFELLNRLFLFYIGLSEYGNARICDCCFDIEMKLLYGKKDLVDVHTYSNETFDAMDYGDFGLLKLMVKYGIASLPLMNSSIQASLEHTLDIWSELPRLTLGIEYEEFNSPAELLKMYVNRCGESNPRNILIFWTMDIIVSYLVQTLDPDRNVRMLDEDEIREKINCLNLLVDSSPLPLVTAKDIDMFLGSFFRRTKELKELKDLIHETFEELFPKREATLKPRTLKDLSRCKIRDSFHKSVTLPEQVSRLKGIPTPIKAFLLLEN